ncbi:hypothetical protein RND71_004544 [Anisodus tanguticus]|uniref:Uncharacterized protein n=1 Tax=Anisodus tanguticus TaxID=243964 RepID=A0AAE1VLT8_9SOLA|nr:hypothetical protein RND71_004544 [Anisodus tanguticus]
MAYQRADRLNYMSLDKEMADSIDEFEEVFYNEDTNFDDFELGLPETAALPAKVEVTEGTDTSASQARKGKDIQGIPWERLNITRQSYRLTRLEQYRNYENIPFSGEAVDKECKQVKKGGNYYDFFHNTRLVKPTVLHFQFTPCFGDSCLLAASIYDFSTVVRRWMMRGLPKNCKILLAIALHPVLYLFSGIMTEDFLVPDQASILITMNIPVYLCLDKPGISFCARTTYEENAITNAVEMYDSMSGGLHFMAANNDCGVREYDMEKFQLMNYFRFPWPVNHTSMSPDSKILTVVGDDLTGLLVDSCNGKTIGSIVGHLDYSFASAWHPDGRTFTTGNQDKACRIWDMRNLSPTAVLKGNMGAVRSIRYSSDGRFLVVAEPTDFVHIYNAEGEYKKRQEIDMFGEISGVSLSPDDEFLYIGIWDRTYASLLQYSRKRSTEYVDLFT